MSDQLTASMSASDRLELLLRQIIGDACCPDTELVEFRLQEINDLDDFIIAFFEWVELNDYFPFAGLYKMLRNTRQSCYGTFEIHALLLLHLLEQYRTHIRTDAEQKLDSEADLKGLKRKSRSGLRIYRNQAIKEKPKELSINFKRSLQ